MEQLTRRDSCPESLSADDSCFDFGSPPCLTHPYQTHFPTPGPAGMLPWEDDLDFLLASTSASSSLGGISNDPQPLHDSNILTDLGAATPRLRHGQLTPPEDISYMNLPEFQFHERLYNEDFQPPQSIPLSKNSSHNRTTKSDAVGRPRKRAREINSSSVAKESEVEDAKRSKCLERNRAAASKCRQKKKEWTSNLELRSRELRNSNRLLHWTATALKQEVSVLKSDLLKQSSCDCAEVKASFKLELDDSSGSQHEATTLNP